MKEKFKRQHLKVQKEIEKLPAEQKQAVLTTQRLVDMGIDQVNEDFFSDKAFALDTFFTTHGLLGSDREEFMSDLKSGIPGKTFTFKDKHNNYKSFYKTLNNELMLTDDYIYTIEYNIIKKNREHANKILKEYFTSLGLLGKIKLTLNLFFTF